MGFASPIWLIALLPWAAVTIWLMRGRRQRVGVPFVQLWRSSEFRPSARSSLRPPPLGVALVLAAALSMILAAGRPMLRHAGGRGANLVSIIVDRGMTMSAPGPEGRPRYVNSVDDAWPEVTRELGGASPAEIVAVPEAEPVSSILKNVPAVVRSIPPTALDVREALKATIAARLTASAGPVLVVSDQPVDITDPRVIRIPPAGEQRGVDVTVLSYRERPMPQVMVGVRNRSPLRTIELRLGSSGAVESHTIELPPAGQSRNYFFDGPRRGDALWATLRSPDLPTDAAALSSRWLAREHSSRRIAARAGLPPEVGRLIDVYQRARPAADGGDTVDVVTEPSSLPADRPGVIVAAANIIAEGRPQAVAGPVTDHVRWDQFSASYRVAASPPPPGWIALVSAAAGRTLVAERPGPVAQIWVGFDAPGWSTSADFVVFWTNVLDRVAQADGDEPFAAHDLSEWTPDWLPAEPIVGEPGRWPGLYRRRDDGALRAFVAADMPFLSTPTRNVDWPSRLAALPRASVGGIKLTPWLLVVAAGCLLLAVSAWPRNGNARSATNRSPRREIFDSISIGGG